MNVHREGETRWAVEPENVIVEVFKKAYDTEAFILRLYEAHGESAQVTVEMPWEIRFACETDLMEKPTGEVAFEGNILHVPIAPYEIKTLLLSPQPIDP